MSEEESGESGAKETAVEKEEKPEAEEKVEEKPLVKSGDLILVDYTVRVKETGELVETTLEKVAKEEGIEAAGPFEPRLVIPGKGFLLKAIEEALIGMEPGEEKKFEIPPEKVWPELQQAQRPAAAPPKISEILNYILAVIVVIEAIAIIYLVRRRGRSRPSG